MSAIRQKFLSKPDARLSPVLVLQEDTRQQKDQHLNIHQYCEREGIKIVRTKLLVGDYMLTGPESGGISVDTKASVIELASNCLQEHPRFRREILMAKDCGIQLVILTEEVLPGGRLDNWRSPMGADGLPRCRFDPSILRKVMITMQERYGVKFRFCSPKDTGKTLIAYLKGELR